MIISSRIHIADEDIRFEYIRSGGPGGQNVNKVSSAVRLRVRLDAIQGLDEAGRARLVILAGSRLTSDGELLLRAESHRTQEANRTEALARLAELLRQAGTAPRRRRPTRPTRASRERRLDAKSRRSALKAGRRGSVEY